MKISKININSRELRQTFEIYRIFYTKKKEFDRIETRNQTNQTR